jgi:hypothetical protein
MRHAVMMNVIISNVIMLNVVAPTRSLKQDTALLKFDSVPWGEAK